MGIHILALEEVTQPAELYKLARRYAMTGGYEIVVGDNLTTDELTRLVDIYSGELMRYPAGTSARQASLAYRLLSGIKLHKNCTSQLEKQVTRSIFKDTDDKR